GELTLRKAPSPLHARAFERDPRSGSDPKAAPHLARRRRSEPARSAGGLRVPSSLPARRKVKVRRRYAAARRARARQPSSSRLLSPARLNETSIIARASFDGRQNLDPFGWSAT